MKLTIDEAIRYLRDAEERGYRAPDIQELSTMSEQEIIKLAQDLQDEADNYYGGLN